jgi:hypothetical protein
VGEHGLVSWKYACDVFGLFSRSRWYYLFVLLLVTGFSGSKNRKSGWQNGPKTGKSGTKNRKIRH